MSLLACIRKAGKHLHADDKAAILKLATGFREAGDKANVAAQKAVEQHLAAIRGELDTAESALLPGLPKTIAAQAVEALARAGLGNLKLVESVDQLPESGQRKIQSEGASGTRGMYDPDTDTTYLVRQNIASLDEAFWVGLHEAFHRGLRKTVGAEVEPLLQAIHDGNPRVQALAARYMEQQNIPLAEAIEEVLADMAGQGEVGNLKGWDALLAFLKDAINKLAQAAGVKLEVTDQMVTDLVAGMRRAGMQDRQNTVNQSARDVTETPEFKRWFGDSKVVDADGKPLMVYRGRKRDYETMARNTESSDYKYGSAKDSGGLFFHSDPQEVDYYMRSGSGYARGANVMPVYLALRNPAQIPSFLSLEKQANALQQAEEAGHDGAFLSNGDIAVFNPEQIKSAIGNRGTFDPADPNILNQGPRGSLSFGNDITAVPSIIALIEGADLSTFLHEGGHFFLEVQADLAARIQRRIADEQYTGELVSESEKGIVADMEAILTWMGITGSPELSALDTWASMTLEEKREHHEKWARGFERYVMEGKAPSQELQGLFSKFRAWLVSVYKALASLNVELTPEVRQVMDRMLASDEAIAEAQMARDMGPLFESPEAAGMTPAQYRDYQAQGERQTAEAAAQLDARLMKDMKWLSKARDKAMKAKQDEAEDLRREVRMEVTTEVMARPVYRAWAFLTSKAEYFVEPGLQMAQTVDATRQSGKLRTSYLKESHPNLWKTLSERRMTSEERGLDPDYVADVIGFSSGDEMVQALAAAPAPKQLIEEMVDQQMLERYGDITSDEALQRAADEAVHNEVRARVVATELKALEKAGKVRAGPRSTVDAMARAAKEYAYQVIAGQRVRDLRPSQYSAAQARSARLAQQALGKSTEEAAMHKRNELINGYAAKAAYDAQEEVRSLQKYMRKFDKRIDGIDPGYQDQIEQLLERFDFKSASLKAIDERAAFAQWYAEQEKEGVAPSVPDELLDEANRKSYKDMTVEELRGLYDTVKQIEHQGRNRQALVTLKGRIAFNAAAEAVAASIIANGGKARDVPLEGPNSLIEKAADKLSSFVAGHRKLSSLFRQMDGHRDDGPLWEFIGRDMNELGTREDVMLEQATVALGELYAPLLKMRGGITGYRSKLHIPEIGASLTRGGRLAVALNYGNEANRQRLLDGNKWTDGQARAVMRTLSPVELEFVNKMWAYLDTFWPAIAAKEKRLTGVEPEKVKAEPFNAFANDGTEVAMTGGYLPIKYDPAGSDRTVQQDAAQIADEMKRGAFTRATTRRGHTKARVKEVKRKLRLDLNVITQHVTQVAHDLAWHEWLISTNKLLRDDRVAGAIRTHYGQHVLQTIRADLDGIATGDMAAQTVYDDLMLGIRNNVSRATMGLSSTTALMQPFGLFNSMERIGVKPVLHGMAKWAGDAVMMENAIGKVHAKSPMMRLRAKTFNRELREISGAVGGKSTTMKVVDAGLFFMMQKMQMVADIPTWIGQYEKSMAAGLDEAEAIALADRAVIESQGSGHGKDLSEVQRKHPFLTQFFSYFNTTYNRMAESTAKTSFTNPVAVAGWLADMTLLATIPSIGPALLLFSLRGGDGDDEKGWLRRLLEWKLSYLLGTVVLARELSGGLSGFDYAGPPVARLGVDLVRAGKQTVQGEIDEPLVLAYINLLGSAFGIPTVQAIRSYKGWKAWSEGVEGAGPQSVLFGPPPKD